MQAESDAAPAPRLPSFPPLPLPFASNTGAQRTVLFPLRTRGTAPPLYLVHGVGGGMAWGYQNLTRHLQPQRPVFGFHCRAARGVPEHETIEEMAAEYVDAVRRHQPEGPYHLGGYCFGGNVAFEMARQLEAAGERVALVVLFNSVPANCRYDEMRWTPATAWKFGRNLAYWAVQLSTSRTARASELLAWKWRTLRRKVARRCGLAGPGRVLHVGDLVELADLTDPADAERWKSHLRAFYRFRPRAWSGRVLLLRTRGHQMFCTFAPDYGWSEFALGGVEVRVLGGEHESILEEPHVAETAHALDDALAKSPAATPGPAESGEEFVLEEAVARPATDASAAASGAERIGGTSSQPRWMAV